MGIRPILCAGTTSANHFAKKFLAVSGMPVCDAPGWDTGHLLLDVPSFPQGSPLVQRKNLDTLLASLPEDITIWGGNLEHPALASYRRADLLQDEAYLSENAAITAYCALEIAAPLLPVTFSRLPVLVIGWGRIGKCLSQLLRNLGAKVIVSARNHLDLCALRSLGYETILTEKISEILPGMRLIFNTVPFPVIRDPIPDAVKIDLASQKGILDPDTVWARGLPGLHAPESSGKLIAQTILRRIREGEK